MQLSRLLVMMLSAPIRAYQLLLSPMLGANCRYFPSCSAYALQALEQRGPCEGTYLALRRVCRCGPWGAGGIDEVPTAPTRIFSKFVRPTE